MSRLPEPASFERALDALGPMLVADSLEEAAAHATRLLAQFSGAEVVALFLVAGKDTGAEFWVPGDEGTRLRFRPHLRGLALESLARNEPVLAPFPPEVARDLEPAVIPLLDDGHVVALACFAGRAQEALRCAAVGPVVARQVTRHLQAANSQASKERYERWFRQFDQQMRALERERQKFAALVSQAGLYVYSVDLAGTVRWTSRALITRCPAPDARGWVGRPADELWARLFDGRPPTGDSPVAAALQSGRASQKDVECCGSSSAGYHVTALPIREPDGRTTEVLMVVQDLGGLEVVRRMETGLRAVVSNAPVVLFSIDADGIFRLSEGRALAGIGLRPGEVVGRSVYEVYASEPEIIEMVRRALAGEEFTNTGAAAGRVFESRFTPQRDAAGTITGVTGVSVDVTERIRLEERLRAAQQSEVLGSFAARAAGEFGELLTVIMGNAGMLLGQLGEGHPLRQPAEELRRAGTRGAELVRQLRTLSRRGETEPGPLDPDHLLADAADLLRRVAGPAELLLLPGACPACVRAEREQLEQVLVDLVIQVRDRLPGGGRVVLERGEIVLGPDDPARDELPEGRYVTWSARGDAARGDGRPAVRSGAERGLGLSLAQDLARLCGGDIRTGSDAVGGPEITLRLPWLEPGTAESEDRRAA